MPVITLGGGLRGIAPHPTSNGTMKGSSEHESVRFILRKAWNGGAASNNIKGYVRAATPFRIVNNAGDYLSRVNYTSGGSNQVKRGVAIGWRSSAGGIHTTNDITGIPSATCNPKYVYDSSDYIRFRKQMAVNRTYDDVGFGGAMGKVQLSVR